MATPSTKIRTLHVRIEGRVQGVGYRYWTEQTALALGIDGWVRNRRDASVEALFSGSQGAVAEMLDRCRSGPRLASAVVVTVLDEDARAVSGFEILTTI